MRFTLVAPATDRLIDREYNAGLGAGFSIGTGWRAKLLERMRRRMGESIFMPFGYISAILKAHGHEVLSSDKVPAEGVMVIAPTLANFRGDLAAVKLGASHTRLKVIVVGQLATIRPEEFAPYAYAVIKGEPESTFLSMTGETLPQGVVTAPTIQDLDTLPFPDWTIFRRKRAAFSLVLREKAYAFVQASRSCPYTCGYCPYISTSAYRQRSVSSVIDELRQLCANNGVRAVVFRDPTFTLRRNWVVEFCEALLAANLGLVWECETRMDRLDAPLLRLMSRAGLVSVKVGIESADDNVLRDVRRRPISQTHQEAMVTECGRLRISVVGFYVLGLPTDTEESIRATIRYAKRLNTDVARFHIFTPLPGTPLYETERHRITEDDWDKFDMFHVVFRHANVPADLLYKLKEEAYVSYYYRYSYLSQLVLGSRRRRAARRAKRRPRSRPGAPTADSGVERVRGSAHVSKHGP
jgi:anaerobic magnesium-protoporphyrin IX monomethyl ester cyclase